MGSKKTRDGKFRIEDIVKAAKSLDGVNVTRGKKHRYLLNYAYAPIGRCALGSSTDTDHHLVPWFRKATGYDKQTIYNAFRICSWS